MVKDDGQEAKLMPKCANCTWRNAVGYCSAINVRTNPDQPACGHYRQLPDGMIPRDERWKKYSDVETMPEIQEKTGKMLSFSDALQDVGDSKQYLKLEEGLTEIRIVGSQIELKLNNFGKEQYYLEAEIVAVDGKAVKEPVRGVWSITKNSPLARQVLEHLAKGKRKLLVARAGKTQADTKYSIKSSSR